MPIQTSLIAHYKMNDDAATAVVVDETGNNHGTAQQNTEDLTVVGKINKALSFNGADDSINCGSDSSIDNIFDGGGSISVWIKSTTAGEADKGRIFDKTNWSLWMSGVNTTVNFSLFFDGDNGDWTFTVPDNLWTHIVVVYNNDSATNDPVIYVNDVLVSLSVVNTPTGTRTSDALGILYIGNNNDTTMTRTFDGSIDNAMLFNRELTPLEVKYLYNNGHSTEILAEADEPRLLLRRNNSPFGLRSRYEK